MTKDELSEKRNQAIKSLNDVKAILGLDEMYIDELEKENAELKNERNAFKIYSDSAELDTINLNEQLTKAKEIISEWEDSFCCGADYLYLGNKGKELRIKSQKFLNSEVEK